MANQKGVNPFTKGLAKSVLDSLPPVLRACYNDEGLLLDGTVDNSPLETLSPYLAQVLKDAEGAKGMDVKQPVQVNGTTAMHNTAPQEPSVPLSVVEKMIADALAKHGSKPDAPAKPAPAVSVDTIPGFENWEIKPRVYVLCDGSKPVSRVIRNRHKPSSQLTWFDPVKQLNRPLRYSMSEPSVFMDQQSRDSNVKVTYINMREGMLVVPETDVTLQKFLEIHPDNGVVFKELDPKAESLKKLADDEILNKARRIVRDMSFDKQSAIARMMCRTFSESWGVPETKVELFAEVDKNPKMLIDLSNDNTIIMKGIIKTAQHRGFIHYSNFTWKEANSPDSVVISVSPNANEIDALVIYCNSNEGQTFYEYLKRCVA